MSDKPGAVAVWREIATTWGGLVALGLISVIAWNGRGIFDQYTVSPTRVEAVETWQGGHDRSHVTLETDVDGLRGAVAIVNRNLELVLCAAPFISEQVLFDKNIDCQKVERSSTETAPF